LASVTFHKRLNGWGCTYPPPAYTPGTSPNKIIPLEPGGQNQQSGQGPRIGCPPESYVFVVTEVGDHEIPGGKVEYVVRLGLTEVVMVGPLVIVPVYTLLSEAVVVVGIIVLV